MKLLFCFSLLAFLHLYATEGVALRVLKEAISFQDKTVKEPESSPFFWVGWHHLNGKKQEAILPSIEGELTTLPFELLNTLCPSASCPDLWGYLQNGEFKVVLVNISPFIFREPFDKETMEIVLMLPSLWTASSLVSPYDRFLMKDKEEEIEFEVWWEENDYDIELISRALAAETLTPKIIEWEGMKLIKFKTKFLSEKERKDITIYTIPVRDKILFFSLVTTEQFSVFHAFLDDLIKQVEINFYTNQAVDFDDDY